MLSEGLVSVIISSFNHGPYIEQSILSVIGQTYQNIELLVIDDGSSDDSVKRIQSLQSIYGFDFRAQKNRGLTRTLNDAISRSRGTFIAPFGSDDIMLKDRLATQMKYISDKPEVGICAGNIQLIHADGTLFSKEQITETPFRRLDFEDVLLERKFYAPAPTLLIRREAFDKVGGFNPEIRLEDLFIQLKITDAGYFIDVLESTMAQYRKHGNNSYRNIRFMAESILRIYEDYCDHPAYETAKFKLLNSMFIKASKRDRELAAELLAQLPIRAWNRKTLRGLFRYRFAPNVS